MRPSGVERDHDLRILIAGIDLGDLHADRRIGETGAFPFELRDLLAVGEDRDDRRARDLAVLALVLAYS